MKNRLTLAALLVLTPALSFADIDVAALKDKITNVVNELKVTTLPAVEKAAQAIKDKDFTLLTTYFADPSKPLIPKQAFQFAADNIGAVQNALLSVLQINVPQNVVGLLDSVSNGLGSQIKDLQSQATSALQKINLAKFFNNFANVANRVTTGDAQKFALALKNQYQQSNVNADALIASARKLEGTLDSLKTAAIALQQKGILDTLNQLSTDVPRFITGDQAARENLSDNLIGLLTDLNAQAPAAKPFINAFGDFSEQFIPFAEQLYTAFGPALWAQIPAQEQQLAKKALDNLKQNQGAILNAINTAKEKIAGLADLAQ